jgi:hypothetical protein
MVKQHAKCPHCSTVITKKEAPIHTKIRCSRKRIHKTILTCQICQKFVTRENMARHKSSVFHLQALKRDFGQKSTLEADIDQSNL